MTLSDSTLQTSQAAENRRHRRVSVRLGVAVVIDRSAAFDARTCDISEGGLLVNQYLGPALAQGRLVGITMRGVVSDAGDGHAERYLMRVVRHTGDMLALRFASDAL